MPFYRAGPYPKRRKLTCATMNQAYQLLVPLTLSRTFTDPPPDEGMLTVGAKQPRVNPGLKVELLHSVLLPKFDTTSPATIAAAVPVCWMTRTTCVSLLALVTTHGLNLMFAEIVCVL